jgi:predicted dienelactone hydrolase
MSIITFFLAAALAGGSYRDAGSLKVDERTDRGCTIFAPVELSGGHPVILWGNGTGAKVSSYRPVLRHLATHGFVVVAANTPEAGTGAEMLACLDQVGKGSLAPKLDLSKVGAMGHSQGAWGAIQAGRDGRIKATAPIQPGGGNMRIEAVTAQSAPMLLISGGDDRIAPPARAQALIFRTAPVPVVWATLKGAGHLAPADDPGSRYREATAAWFSWRLKGDAEAAKLFDGAACGFCNAREWIVERKE